MPAPGTLNVWSTKVFLAYQIMKAEVFVGDNTVKPRWLEHRAEAVLTSTHNLRFEQKLEKYQNFLSENFQFLVVKFSIHFNRRVFVM